jgi:hypothetical protein
MTRAEAYAVIDRCKDWNTSQVSPSLSGGGPRKPDDDIYDARRAALAAAWQRLALPHEAPHSDAWSDRDEVTLQGLAYGESLSVSLADVQKLARYVLILRSQLGQS